MNDRINSPAADGGALVDPALPAGARVGPFELQLVLARSSSTVVYQAIDHSLALPVAVQEYLPTRMVRREPDLQLRAVDDWQADVVARGLRAFVEETRFLARCDHPALVRVLQLLESNGTAYRVMPLYHGERLLDLRRDMAAAPAESALRALAGDLLGALSVIHAAGKVHGALSPSNILLLGDDHAMLLGPGAANAEVSSDLVDSLMAGLESSAGSRGTSGVAAAMPTGVSIDLFALAETLRFCITGKMLPMAIGRTAEHPPIAEAIAAAYEPSQRPRYSEALIETLDAAVSPFAEDRPLNVAQFRDWLDRGPPRGWRRNGAAADEGGLVAAAQIKAAAAAAAALSAAPAAASAPLEAAVAAPTTPPSVASPRATPARPPAPPPSAGDGPTWPSFGPDTARVETPDTGPSFLPDREPVGLPDFEPRMDTASTDRGDRVPPELPAQLRRPAAQRRRSMKMLLAATLALLTAGIAVYATGPWQQWVPDLQWARPAAPSAIPREAPPTAGPPAALDQAPPALNQAPAALNQVPPALNQAPATPNRQPATTTAAADGPAAASAAAAPPSAEPPAPAQPVTAAAPAASAAVARIDPETTLASQPTTAGRQAPEPGAAASAPVSAAAPPPASPAPPAPVAERAPARERPRKTAAAPLPAIANPRAACGERSEFALYRCMQTQCANPRWYAHAQCIHLRQTDRVD